MIGKKIPTLLMVGACILGLSALASVKNPVARQLRSYGHYTTVINLLDGSFESTAVVNGTHIGRGEVHAFGEVDLATFAVVWIKGTVTAANGDQVFLEQDEITGGTGRFEGATGCLTDSTSTDVESTFEGNTLISTYNNVTEGIIIY